MDVEIGNGAARLLQGDCLERLKGLPDCSVDAVVTDPPYGLSDHKPADVVACLSAWLKGEEYRPNKRGFMGRTWDSWVPGPEVWREVFRVLKPGGHVVAFAGSRTHDLMSMALRLAGFECRDTVMWVYASGMPKSFNLDRLAGDKICGCPDPYTQNETEQKTEHDLHSVRESDVSPPQHSGEWSGEVLQQSVQEQGAPIAGRKEFPAAEVWRGEPVLEGRSDASSSPRELCSGSVREGTGGCCDHGTQGRLCNGAPLGDGAVDWPYPAAAGGCASRRPRSAEQCTDEPGAVAGQPEPQAMGAWPVCGRCGLPRVPSGLGTALKPAFEPALLFRKPLVGTVAENVLAHGTGALNIDGCRVETTDDLNGGAYAKEGGRTESSSLHGGSGMNQAGKTTGRDFVQPPGRWPANVIHDGSDEVVALFPDAKGAVSNGKRRGNGYGEGFGSMVQAPGYGDAGSAARFFYTAKVSKKERNEGLSDGVVNTHPTLKPVSLMAYLCRLVTPPGGIVLDPFMGSGSTGKAAIREGFRFIGCELSDEYLAIARARIEHAWNQANPEPVEPAQEAGQLALFG